MTTSENVETSGTSHERDQLQHDVSSSRAMPVASQACDQPAPQPIVLEHDRCNASHQFARTLALNVQFSHFVTLHRPCVSSSTVRAAPHV
eukprot:1414056-Pleurochrysis_carterae.AAC.1